MRGFVRIAGVLLLAQTLASPSLAQGLQACRVVAVDTVSMNFVCRTSHIMRQYWVTRATQFVTRGPRGSFFDLKTDQRVQVVSHNSGPLQIADRVIS
jgi:hypothetical protein